MARRSPFRKVAAPEVERLLLLGTFAPNLINRFVPILIALAVFLVLGVADVAVELKGLVRRLNFTLAYRERWVAFFEAGRPEDYGWLTEKLSAMSREMGGEGIVVYRARLGGLSSPNYALLPNTLAGWRMGEAQGEEIAMADHLLLVHAGALKHRVESLEPQLKNPLALVGRGLKFVLSLPLLLLEWFGLLRPASVQSARESWLFRLVQLVAGVAVALASIEASVVGWSAFVTQIQSWLPRLH
jgi:hypothetical protein